MTTMDLPAELAELLDLLSQLEHGAIQMAIASGDPQATPGHHRQAYNSIADSVATLRVFVAAIKVRLDP